MPLKSVLKAVGLGGAPKEAAYQGFGDAGRKYRNWTRDRANEYYDFGRTEIAGQTYAQRAAARQLAFQSAADRQTKLGGTSMQGIRDARNLTYDDVASSPEFAGRQRAINEAIGAHGAAGNYLSGAALGTRSRATADNYSQTLGNIYERRMRAAQANYDIGSRSLGDATQYRLAGIDAPETAYTQLAANRLALQDAGQRAYLDSQTQNAIQAQAYASRQADRQQQDQAMRVGLLGSAASAAAGGWASGAFGGGSALGGAAAAGTPYTGNTGALALQYRNRFTNPYLGTTGR